MQFVYEMQSGASICATFELLYLKLAQQCEASPTCFSHSAQAGVLFSHVFSTISDAFQKMRLKTAITDQRIVNLYRSILPRQAQESHVIGSILDLPEHQ